MPARHLLVPGAHEPLTPPEHSSRKHGGSSSCRASRTDSNHATSRIPNKPHQHLPGHCCLRNCDSCCQASAKPESSPTSACCCCCCCCCCWRLPFLPSGPLLLPPMLLPGPSPGAALPRGDWSPPCVALHPAARSHSRLDEAEQYLSLRLLLLTAAPSAGHPADPQQQQQQQQPKNNQQQQYSAAGPCVLHTAHQHGIRLQDSRACCYSLC